MSGEEEVGSEQAGWYESFGWKEGARLETYYNGDWWESQVLRIHDDQVKIHYIGGKKDEDEWLMKSSIRLRPPQRGTAEEIPSSNSSRSPDMNSVHEVAEVDSEHSNEGSGHRPVRQSRITSGDARLAWMLQEEEMKASRKILSEFRKRKRSRSPQASRIPNAPDPCVQPTKQSSKHSAASVQKIKSQLKDPDSKVEVNLSLKASSTHAREVQHNSATGESKKGKPQSQVKSKNAALTSPPKSVKAPVLEDKSGMVSLLIHPDVSSEDSLRLPALKRGRMCLAEDSPIFQIKRLIVDEIQPGMCIDKIELRTPCGALVGQDHTLKYVRTVLWPKSLGNLALSYRLSKDKLL